MRIREQLLAGLLLLLLAVPAGAQVFWSIRDDEGRRNWLLGTVHSEDARLLEWPAPLVDALVRADRLALELVPDQAMLRQMRESMLLPEGRLVDRLGEPLYGRVEALLQADYGLAPETIGRMRPWAVALTLATPPAETGLFMDAVLATRARGAGLEVVALETVDEQIDFLADLPDADQVELIRHTVADYESGQETFEALVAAYLDGDLARLERLAAEEMRALPECIGRHFRENGLVFRNRRMLERAEAWLSEGGLIMAVGALHLPGEDGLVEMLRRAGWRVEGIY